MNEVATLNHLWMNSCRKYRTNTAFARHAHDHDAEDESESEVLYYKKFTYGELDTYIVDIGAALAYIGLREKDRVAIVSHNSTRMLITDFAILGNRACTVPIATYLNSDEIGQIISDLKCKLVVVDDEERLEALHDVIDSIESVHAVVVLSRDYCSPPTEEKKIVFAFDHLMQLGEDSKQLHVFQNRRESTEPQDLASIMYTSGTTGPMKGVPLSHRNIMSNVMNVSSLVAIEESDRFLSILPSWHSFERTLEYIVLYCGASIWYSEQGRFNQDLHEIKPNYMASVPRIWISIYNKVKARLRKSGQEKLFNKFLSHSQRVLRVKRMHQARYIQRKGSSIKRRKATLIDYMYHYLGNIFFYGPIRRKIGGHFKAGISGGGHLPDYIEDFFEVLNIPLLEGYGLTEAAPVISVRSFDHNIPHTAGRPIPETSLLFIDEDGIEADPSDGGVVHVRGPQVIDGYIDGGKLDLDCFYEDSFGKRWLNTKDVGYLSDSGDLVILGRSTEILTLSSGDQISPERIEAALLRSSLISQAFVCKAQEDDRLFALIVPDKEALKSKCKRRLIPYSLDRDNARVQRLYEKRIEALLHVGHLHEITISGFAFVEPFTREDHTMTHTFKLKRAEIIKRSKSVLDELIQEA